MVALRNRLAGSLLPTPTELFTLTFADGTKVKCSEFAPVDMQDNTVHLRHSQSGTNVQWRVIADPEAHYFRQEITVAAQSAPLAVRDVELVSFRGLSDALVIG